MRNNEELAYSYYVFINRDGPEKNSRQFLRLNRAALERSFDGLSSRGTLILANGKSFNPFLEILTRRESIRVINFSKLQKTELNRKCDSSESRSCGNDAHWSKGDFIFDIAEAIDRDDRHGRKRALIIGVSGQVGNYLARYLLAKKYEVHGTTRNVCTKLEDRDWIFNNVHRHVVDVLYESDIEKAIRAANPDEIYNLAAQQFTPLAWERPVWTADATALGALRVLEAAYHVNPRIRVYQASSSEIFGNAVGSPQTELTPIRPRSPYGTAKLLPF